MICTSSRRSPGGSSCSGKIGGSSASGTPEEILSDRSLLLAANLVHLHRHAHEDYWHAHEHEHPEVFHVHEHRDGSPRGEKEGR